MVKLIYVMYVLSSIFIIAGCSQSSNFSKEEEGSDVYVFDEIPPDTSKIEHKEAEVSLPGLPVKYYLVQIGAFTTKRKADEFAEASRIKLNKEVSVIYNSEVNLFVVQLAPIISLREEAENIRNNLWKMDEYKDAWIVTVTK